MPNPKDAPATSRAVGAPTPVGPPNNQVLCGAFNADGTIFVTGSSDKMARVWDARKWNDDVTGRPNYELDTLKGHENDVNYVQFSGCAAPSRPSVGDMSKEDHHFKNSWSAHDSIVTCSRDGSAIIWTPRTRKYHVSLMWCFAMVVFRAPVGALKFPGFPGFHLQLIVVFDISVSPASIAKRCK
jgi:PH-interacting protein